MYSSGDKLRVEIAKDNDADYKKRYTSSAIAFDDTWHHVAFTFSDGILKLYIDGVEDTNVTKDYDKSVSYLYSTIDSYRCLIDCIIVFINY